MRTVPADPQQPAAPLIKALCSWYTLCLGGQSTHGDMVPSMVLMLLGNPICLNPATASWGLMRWMNQSPEPPWSPCTTATMPILLWTCTCKLVGHGLEAVGASELPHGTGHMLSHDQRRSHLSGLLIKCGHQLRADFHEGDPRTWESSSGTPRTLWWLSYCKACWDQGSLQPSGGRATALHADASLGKLGNVHLHASGLQHFWTISKPMPLGKNSVIVRVCTLNNAMAY